uniref:Uncharacterized protein n=1 Tax=Anguilla anguilla TaxID=7936 RepID=A0A0E9T1S9_ANGAN
MFSCLCGRWSRLLWDL